ncbi:MAG: GatB/YqeY domain-containing protein [Ilumatobacteraceae bacterium]
MSNASLKITLQNDLNTAMKAGDEMTKSTLRMLISAVKNAEVAGKQAVDLSDPQVIDVLRAEAKKRAESAELYAGAGRNELADKERAEILVIERYLPAAIDADALAAIVADEVGKAAAAGQSGPKAMGVVIKAVKERVGGGADGAAIAAAVKSALG